MDRDEARAVLAAELERYRSESYHSLQRLLTTQDTCRVTGPSGTVYQLEIQAVWDDGRPGNLRVLAMVDDGGWRALAPLTDDFIITPSGAPLPHSSGS